MTARSVQQSLRNAVQKREKPPVETLVAPVEAVPEAPADDLEIPAYLRRRKADGL
jgi:hypothetical protein